MAQAGTHSHPVESLLALRVTDGYTQELCKLWVPFLCLYLFIFLGIFADWHISSSTDDFISLRGVEILHSSQDQLSCNKRSGGQQANSSHTYPQAQSCLRQMHSKKVADKTQAACGEIKFQVFHSNNSRPQELMTRPYKNALVFTHSLTVQIHLPAQRAGICFFPCCC